MRTYDPHKSKVDVRQSDTRKMNLRVLIWSAVGAAVLLLTIAWLFVFLS